MLRIRSVTRIVLAAWTLLAVFMVSPPMFVQAERISGQIVYTAELANGDIFNTSVGFAGSNRIMFSNTIGADIQDGRDHIAGGGAVSADYPRLSSGNIIVCEAFPDPDASGNADLDGVTPFTAVLNLDGTDVTPITDPADGAAYGGSFAPNQRRIALAFADEDTDGDGVITRLDTAHLAILPLAALDPENPTASQLDRGRPVQIVAEGDFSVYRPEFASNRLIVFTGTSTIDNQQNVYTYDIRTEELKMIPDAPGQTRNPSPRGNNIAMEVDTGSERYVAVYNLGDNTWERISPEGVDASSPSYVGRRIAMVITDGGKSQVWVWDRGEMQQINNRNETISRVILAPEGNAVSYVYTDATTGNNVLAIETLDGGYRSNITNNDSNVIDFDWVNS